MAVSRAKVRWDLLGLPAVFGDRDSPEDRCDIDFLAWADDLVLFSNTLDGIHSMFKILDEELHRVFLSIKPGSLELLRCGGGWVAKEFVWGGACGISHTISLRENMVLLGVAVDSVGSAASSLEHRMAQGWVHWHAKNNLFCSDLIPLRLRWGRLRETIFRTVLFGSGGWKLSDGLISKLDSMENKMLKLTLCRSPRAGESDEDFHRRLNGKIRDLKEKWGWTPLIAMALNSHFSWWGHVVRLHEQSPLRRLMNWRDLDWLRNRSANMPKCARRGPAHTWDEILVNSMGSWQIHAQDRKHWQQLRIWAVQQHFGELGRGIGTMGFLKHISNKIQDFTQGRNMKYTCNLLHIVDNMQVSQYCSGLWNCAADSPFAPYVHFLRWSCHALEHCWKFLPTEGSSKFIVHRPRSLNSCANELANQVLDSSEGILNLFRLHEVIDDLDSLVQLHEDGVRFNPSVFLMLSSDGACRGNPGTSSAAACLHLYIPEFNSILVGRWGIPVGFSTNVHAEFESACLAVRLLLIWCAHAGMCI